MMYMKFKAVEMLLIFFFGGGGSENVTRNHRCVWSFSAEVIEERDLLICRYVWNICESFSLKVIARLISPQSVRWK